MNGSSSTTRSFSPPVSGPRPMSPTSPRASRHLPSVGARSADASAAYRPHLKRSRKAPERTATAMPWDDGCRRSMRRGSSTMQVLDTFLDAMGNTPLVRLRAVTRGLRPSVIAKLEMLNPGGSVKDRIGIRMIEDAERRGLLRPGGTIVEPTSGNTGHGLAIAAAIKGYRCIFVMPDKMSQEKIALLRAYGAEVVICPTAVPRDSPESYYSVADRLAQEIPGAYQPNQYFNQVNPQTHEETTGPEIWAQTDGKVDVFVAGVGTGGTITGVARYLKRMKPEVTIVDADTEGSVYTGDTPRP